MKKDWFLAILIFVAIAFLKFFFHEFWKDEWQAWLVVRDMSIPQMLNFLNYEGHPSLWYLYLKPFTLFSSFLQEDVLLNLAHLLLVGASLSLFFIKIESPFLLKVLASLSYFFFFEYGVVNRGYILVILFSLLSVYALQKDNVKYIFISLFLLCQTEVYGVLLGFSFVTYYYFSRGTKDLRPYIYYALGALLFLITVFPRGRGDHFTRAYNKSIFTIQTIGDSFQGLLANTFGIGLIGDTSTYGYSTIGLLLSLLILGIIIYLFINIKKDGRAVFIGFAALTLFSIFVFVGGVRQWGMMYLLLICFTLLNHEIFRNKVKYGLVIALLIAPIFHNAKAIIKEISIPFSNAKEAAKFIKEKIPTNVPIVSTNKFETAGVGAYAERKFYEFPSGTPFTYFKWLEKIYVAPQSEYMLFAKFKGVKGIVVISPTPLDKDKYPLLKPWTKFDKENFKSEEYYFYVMNLSGRN